MEPVLQRLGNVTIQKIEKPKHQEEDQSRNALVSADAQLGEENEHSEEYYPSNENTSEDEPNEQRESAQLQSQAEPSTDLKRSFATTSLNLGPQISFKKFKSGRVPEPTPETTATEIGKKVEDDENEPNSSEDDMSYYDSELESEGDLEDLNENLGSTIETKNQPNTQVTVDEVTPPLELPCENLPASPKKPVDNEAKGAPLSQKLVQNLETPVDTPAVPTVKPESHTEEYDRHIKEKLKEMGEITLASVKKGDKPKSNEKNTENEVVITRKSGDEVTVVSKGNLRRNIREVMDETKLDETTLAAQRQEAERLKRVQEQQRILREYQKQAQQEKVQQRVMSMLQGNAYSKPSSSSQTRIGNTVLVKLPNGETKPITKVPKPPYDFAKVQRPEPIPLRPSYTSAMGPTMGSTGCSRQFPRSPIQRRVSGIQLPSSLSLAPVSKRNTPSMPTAPDSDSDSDEDRIMDDDGEPLVSPEDKIEKTADNQPIEVSSDDDCILVSESEADQAEDEDDQDDPSNSGMHTNDEFNVPDEQGRVLVNVGHPEDEPDVFVAPQVARIIKPHQIGGVRFLYDNLVESINRFDSSTGFGCILAHSMGLGKTLQIVTFSDIFLRYTPAKTILCIMPINTLQNWMAEFNMWTPTAEFVANSPLSLFGEVRPRNFSLHVLNDSHKTLVARQKVIRQWTSSGGILLIGYEQFRLLSMKKNPKPKRKAAMCAPQLPDDGKNKPIFDEIYTALVDPGPDLVICDEGHRIKNSHASISTALKQLRTKRRVVLTGYPLQNNLIEYWCMVDFVRPNYLGSRTEFLNMFERPIMNGQCIDSTEADIKLMRYRAHVLHSLLVGFVQRRSHTVLQTVLPQKEEYVLLVRLTPFQRKLYDTFMDEVVRAQAVPNPLKAFAVCCKIWNHPDVLYNFLVKRARGDAVDLDLEEVASTASGVSAADSKAKRGPGKPRKTPVKACIEKPAASVTPYNSNIDPTGPPTNQVNDVVSHSMPVTLPQPANNTSPPKSSDPNYVPYTNEFNQPRTTFEGISQFFEAPVSRQVPYDTNMPFTPFPNANSSQANQHFGDTAQQQSLSNQMSLFNLDSQNTVTVPKNMSNIPSLPTGISLTPVGSKPQSSSSAQISSNQGNFNNSMAPFNSNYRGVQQLQQQFIPPNQGTEYHGYESNVQANYNEQNYWDPEKKSQGIVNSTQLWPIKEETSPIKNESSNEYKPKINIISDIKLPPVFQADKKINIISDIKIEPKKDEKDDDKYGVKQELDKIKSEIKAEEMGKEAPLAKLPALPSIKDLKEDGGIPYDWAIELLKDYVPGQIENAAKFEILFCIIKESLALGDRLLIFSQSLITLDLIEQFLQMSEIPGDIQRWAKNVSYYRLDGSTGAQERERLINEFNSNPKIHLFLVSTRAGSLGINLIGANRVVVLDASWNPCHDTQAVCRVYRYGQRKPCFVYRLVVDNCLEKKIYDRQVSKQGMSDRVVDECNPDAHLTIKDVSTLCFDDKKEEGEIKDWACCKDNYIDVVLQKVLEQHGKALTKEPFHHESLLVDRKEKQLSQQEKRLAKKGYEREKNAARQPAYLSGMGRGHRPVASVRPMQQGSDRPTRWIPAEHWRRQGMTAQEMTLPLDVVIPTNQPDKEDVILKAGQKVLVLKSPKGVFMQLETGKIVAIKTAMKAKGKNDDSSPDNNMKYGGKSPMFHQTQMKNASMSVMPQRRQNRVQVQPQMPLMSANMPGGINRVNVRTLPSSRGPIIPRKTHSTILKQKPTVVSSNMNNFPGSSSEDEHPSPVSGANELEQKITQLKKNISIQRVPSGGSRPPAKASPVGPQSSAGLQLNQQQQMMGHTRIQKITPQEKLIHEQDTPTVPTFHETIDSITAGFKNTNSLAHLDSDEDEDDDRPLPEEEEEEEDLDESFGSKQEGEGMEHTEPNEGISDHSDEVTYISEQTLQTPNQQFVPQHPKPEPVAEYNNPSSGYNYNYNYNVPPYQSHPPQQNYGYPPQQHASMPYDGYNNYPHGQPQYNYGYQGYAPQPPPQPHYPAPPPPQPSYDYSAGQPPVYPNYAYPAQQYSQASPVPQAMYPPPGGPSGNYVDYSQYPNQAQPSTNYYPNT